MKTMDFFGHQDQARRASRRLVVYFAAAVVAIITLVYFAVVFVLRIVDSADSWWHPAAFAAVAGGTLLVIVSAAAFKISQLRQGGAFVASLLGGTPVEPETTDLKEKMLRNVVEEMAIASGVPVPAVFVLQDERSINAFAAGWGPWDAAVAVTRGTLEQLDRDELQGVIAHEFSHVFHGDMRLNIRLMGVLFGILCIATIGEIFLRTVGRGAGRRGGKNNPAVALILIAIALLIIGHLGVFFARLIKAAVSRQREFLADASAVQYTRNPRGIGLALAKIGGKGSRVLNAHAEEASHMFFANGIRSWFGGLWATHPPIEERVERVLPGFRRSLDNQLDYPAAAAAAAGPATSGIGPVVGPVARLAGAGRTAGPSPETVLATIGRPNQAHVRNAQQLLAEIPLELHAATRGHLPARALCCALLLDAERERRRAQIDLLQRTADAELAHEASRLFGELQGCPDRVRQPLLELCIPALRRSREADRRALRKHLRALAEADDQLTPLELALLKSIERHLPLAEELAARRRPRAAPLLTLGKDAELLLSVLAHHGHRDDAEAAAVAFAEGCKALEPVGQRLRLRPREECGVRELDAALTRLDDASPLARRQLLLACGRAVGSDGEVRAEEGILLRAVAEAWGCPMPPIWSPDGAMVA